jgi:hypothetical protein
MNRLGYITDGDNVYCAVRTGYLNEISRFSLKEGSAMGQAVNCPPVTTETRVPSQVIPCPFRYLQSGTATCCSIVIPSIIMFHISLCLYVEKGKRTNPENITKSNAVSVFDGNSFYVMLTSKMHFLNSCVN